MVVVWVSVASAGVGSCTDALSTVAVLVTVGGLSKRVRTTMVAVTISPHGSRPMFQMTRPPVGPESVPWVTGPKRTKSTAGGSVSPDCGTGTA